MLRRLHRLNAVILGLFLALHLATHATLTGGIGAHLRTLEALRPLYRAALVEPVLITLFAAQIGLGAALIWRRGRPDSGWAWAQVLSGGYLAIFLLQHVPAVLSARASGLDTNTFFAASVVQRLPHALYFGPYYVLALLALATHLAAILRFRVWPAPAGPLARALPFVGGAFGLIVVAGLIGAFGGPEIPPRYKGWLD